MSGGGAGAGEGRRMGWGVIRRRTAGLGSGMRSTQSTPASISSATVKRSKEMAFAISFLSAASNAATIMRPSST
eukprot:3039814-Rhodomonas_salina.1